VVGWSAGHGLRVGLRRAFGAPILGIEKRKNRAERVVDKETENPNLAGLSIFGELSAGCAAAQGIYER